MCLYKSLSDINYVAKCEYCDDHSQPLSNNKQLSVFKLIEKYDWIVYDDLKTTFCSETCLDHYEIFHIEDILNG